MTDSSPTMWRVALAICTYNRHEELARLLRLADADRRASTVMSDFRFVIVDDSADGNARGLIESLSAEFGRPIEYVNTASRSISIARNAALDHGQVDSDFVVCIDDDCSPEPGWADALVRASLATGAEVIVGHRQFVAPPQAGAWLRDEPFLNENVPYPDLSEPEIGNVANVLYRSSWLQSSGVRFREALGRTSGEDMVFLEDALQSGAKIRFAAHSVVHEPYSAARLSLRYHLWRQCWLGNNEAVINGVTGKLPKWRLVVRALRRIGRGFAHPVRRLIGRQSPQLRWGLATVLSGIGLLAGTAGFHLLHRA